MYLSSQGRGHSDYNHHHYHRRHRYPHHHRKGTSRVNVRGGKLNTIPLDQTQILLFILLLTLCIAIFFSVSILSQKSSRALEKRFNLTHLKKSSPAVQRIPVSPSKKEFQHVHVADVSNSLVTKAAETKMKKVYSTASALDILQSNSIENLPAEKQKEDETNLPIPEPPLQNLGEIDLETLSATELLGIFSQPEVESKLKESLLPENPIPPPQGIGQRLPSSKLPISNIIYDDETAFPKSISDAASLALNKFIIEQNPAEPITSRFLNAFVGDDASAQAYFKRTMQSLDSFAYPLLPMKLPAPFGKRTVSDSHWNNELKGFHFEQFARELLLSFPEGSNFLSTRLPSEPQFPLKFFKVLAVGMSGLVLWIGIMAYRHPYKQPLPLRQSALVRYSTNQGVRLRPTDLAGQNTVRGFPLLRMTFHDVGRKKSSHLEKKRTFVWVHTKGIVREKEKEE
jgi:hypothetical protein